MTSLGQMEDKTTGFEAGADDYLVKPFEFKELLMRIKALSRRPFDSAVTSVKIINILILKSTIGPTPSTEV